MKKIAIISAFLLVGMSTVAQELKFGISAGYQNVKGKISGSNLSDINPDAESGYYVGGLVEIGLLKIIKVQPELLYVAIDESEFLQVPIMVKLYPMPKLYIQAGPQFMYTLEEIGDDFTPLNIGAAAGVGVDIALGFFANARYSFQLNNQYTGSADIESSSNVLSAGVGYTFN